MRDAGNVTKETVAVREQNWLTTACREAQRFSEGTIVLVLGQVQLNIWLAMAMCIQYWWAEEAKTPMMNFAEHMGSCYLRR